MKDRPEFILVGKDLLLRADMISYANLSAKDKDNKDCIKITMSDGVTWQIWGELDRSRKILRSLDNINEAFDLIDLIDKTVTKHNFGSKLSKELREILK